MWGSAVRWWVFVSNFVFWTVGWTHYEGERRHVGLRHAVINIFHHFFPPFIDWTMNQYIMKVIIIIVIVVVTAVVVVGDGQTAVQLLSVHSVWICSVLNEARPVCLHLVFIELHSSGIHPRLPAGSEGGPDHEAFRLELMSHLMFTVFSFYHKEQVHHELPVVVCLWDNSLLKVERVKRLCGLWWQKHELHAMCFHCKPIQLVGDQKQRNRKSAHQLLNGQKKNLCCFDHRVQF